MGDESRFESGTRRQIFLNQLFDEEDFAEGIARDSLRHSLDVTGFRAELKEAFATIDTWGHAEAEVSKRIIEPLLDFLGWTYRAEKTYTVQDKDLRPDFVLLCGESPKSTEPGNVAAILEAKAADKNVDPARESSHGSPYSQLMNYLLNLRVSWGYLCNGRVLYLVDASAVYNTRHFVRVDLMALVEDGADEDWRLFYHLFAKSTYVRGEGDRESELQDIERYRRVNQERRALSENELRESIYGLGGKSSMIEIMGQALYRAARERGEDPDIEDIYVNAQFFAFRLLFLAFFESKYLKSGTLPLVCTYAGFSLGQIHKAYKGIKEPYLAQFDAWEHMQILFRILNKGSRNLSVPLFNGGLFSEENAPMLSWERVFNNGEISKILNMLFVLEGGKERDFGILPVTQLGTIYEGLLSYEFRVAEETLWYLDYKSPGKERLDGYFNAADHKRIMAEQENTVFCETKYEKGSLYFVSSSNTRKSTASYYTPPSLSEPLIRRAVDTLLAGMAPGDSILGLRILDSACGSGHLLVETLNYLAIKAMARIDEDPILQKALEEEKTSIAGEFVRLGLLDREENLDIDDMAVVKRILLKKNIYGVDVQKFSVELTCLSLWIETFVFGTPLSFLEHHVKHGNSLVGCSRAKFEEALAEAESEFALLRGRYAEKRKSLFELYKKLSSLRDTTAEEIACSKAIYREEIQPIIDEMSLYFDCLTMREFKKLEGQRVASCSELFALIDSVLESSDVNGRGQALVDEIRQYKKEYAFFNWQLEFPEAFANGSTSGFHIIVGNPPWDKTKFSDADFFSQYRAGYRKMNNNQKKVTRVELLGHDSIRERYVGEQARARLVNEYFKGAYPLNAGAGDGNLFRFFVERNLGLLCEDGTLNYVLPTGFLTEDGSTTLRKHMLRSCHLLAFDGFENRKKLFPAVDSRYKFGLMQVAKNRELPEDKLDEQTTRCRFMLTDPSSLDDESLVFDYTLGDVKRLSPEHWAFMEMRGGRTDLELLSRLYARFDRLSPSWLDFRSELHATNDKGLFKERRAEGDLPLYRGACVWQYDSRYWERTGSAANRPEYWLEPDAFDAWLRETEISRLISDIIDEIGAAPQKTRERTVLDRLGLAKREELARFVVPDRKFFRLAFRDIAGDTNERTLIAAVVPPDIGAQNKLPLSIPKRYVLEDGRIAVKETSLERLFFAQGLFNSLVVDWMLRFSVAMTVNKTYLMRLPVPQPDDGKILANPVYAGVFKNSVLLSCAHDRECFLPLLGRFGIGEEEVPDTDESILALRAENDALVARAYGLSREELLYILDSFPIFEGKHGKYRGLLSDALEPLSNGRMGE